MKYFLIPDIFFIVDFVLFCLKYYLVHVTDPVLDQFLTKIGSDMMLSLFSKKKQHYDKAGLYCCCYILYEKTTTMKSILFELL